MIDTQKKVEKVRHQPKAKPTRFSGEISRDSGMTRSSSRSAFSESVSSFIGICFESILNVGRRVLAELEVQRTPRVEEGSKLGGE